MIQQLLGLIRFSHTLFALPFALLAAAMATAANLHSHPPRPLRWQDGLGIVLCMVFARSAAMAFNRLADHTLDAANPRTAGRHLPTGQLSPPAVLAFTVANAFVGAYWALNAKIGARTDDALFLMIGSSFDPFVLGTGILIMDYSDVFFMVYFGFRNIEE